ncbi:MAG: hypothetical protein GY828_02610 [Candidatus Gracilibacteria bacterium]|nr:hypothetical protein [Candidatus Gracilibacteria bacterium]
MKKNQNILIISVIVYLVLAYSVPYGNFIVYPIQLFVTFLHEFGHAIFAMLTGGSVKALQINADGSGYAITGGGITSLVLLGGYIGSAIFGNTLLYVGYKKQSWSKNILYFIIGLLIFSAIIWFESLVSSLILFALALLLYTISKQKEYASVILQFLGITTLLYIIKDYSVGPTSDIAKFSDIFIFIPEVVWMIIWLILVLGITGWNVKKIIKK